MTDKFELIRARVLLIEVLRRYGYEPDRAHKLHCPFHPDGKSKSFHLYEATNSFFCFGCLKGGDVIKFVELAENCRPLEAAHKLDSMFHVGAFNGSVLTSQERTEIEKRRSKAQFDEDFDNWLKWAGAVIAEYLDALRRWQKKFAPPPSGAVELPLIYWELARELSFWQNVQYLVFVVGDEESAINLYEKYAVKVGILDEFNQAVRRTAGAA